MVSWMIWNGNGGTIDPNATVEQRKWAMDGWVETRSNLFSIVCQDSKHSNALNLVNVAGIFYILIGGLALAIVIAVLEFLVKASNEAKQTKVNARHSLFDQNALINSICSSTISSMWCDAIWDWGKSIEYSEWDQSSAKLNLVLLVLTWKNEAWNRSSINFLCQIRIKYETLIIMHSSLWWINILFLEFRSTDNNVRFTSR